MEMNDVIKIGTSILLSLGGASFIIFAFSGWLGKVWASRILEQDRIKYQSELEQYKTQLEISKLSLSRYSEYQFKSYNELWLALIELKIAADDLWEILNVSNLKSFIKKLERTKIVIQTRALLIEENHYEQLKDILKRFDHYQFGKIELMNIRRKHIDEPTLARALVEYPTIEENEKDKIMYEALLLNIEHSFRAQLRGVANPDIGK